MKNIKANIIIAIIILAALAGVGFYIYKDFSATQQKQTENQKENNEPEITEINGDNKQADAGLSAEEIKAKMPDLSKPIEVKAELPEDMKNQAIEEIEALSQSLKEDYDTLEGWLQLGLLKKLINDYEGAKEAWEFVALIRPKSAVPFHNLGFLYWQYIKDFSASEKNYLKAIENDSQDINAYVDLSNVYYFDLKDAKKAEDILLKGIQNNPNNPALLAALEELKNR